jgi:hypothetical protein
MRVLCKALPGVLFIVQQHNDLQELGGYNSQAHDHAAPRQFQRIAGGVELDRVQLDRVQLRHVPPSVDKFSPVFYESGFSRV